MAINLLSFFYYYLFMIFFTLAVLVLQTHQCCWLFVSLWTKYICVFDDFWRRTVEHLNCCLRKKKFSVYFNELKDSNLLSDCNAALMTWKRDHLADISILAQPNPRTLLDPVMQNMKFVPSSHHHCLYKPSKSSELDWGQHLSNSECVYPSAPQLMYCKL